MKKIAILSCFKLGTKLNYMFVLTRSCWADIVPIYWPYVIILVSLVQIQNYILL